MQDLTAARTGSKVYRIAVIDGPNVSNLGRRNKRMYGGISYESLRDYVKQLGHRLGVEIEPFISNFEGEILEYIHESSTRVDGYLVNPAGLTMQSTGVPMALFDTGLPALEVHFANIEASAQSARGPVYGPGRSNFTPYVTGLCMGMRHYSYAGALFALVLALDDAQFLGAAQD